MEWNGSSFIVGDVSGSSAIATQIIEYLRNTFDIVASKEVRFGTLSNYSSTWTYAGMIG